MYARTACPSVVIPVNTKYSMRMKIVVQEVQKCNEVSLLSLLATTSRFRDKASLDLYLWYVSVVQQEERSESMLQSEYDRLRAFWRCWSGLAVKKINDPTKSPASNTLTAVRQPCKRTSPSQTKRGTAVVGRFRLWIALRASNHSCLRRHSKGLGEASSS